MMMQEDYQELVINQVSSEKSEILMAELIELGFEGFTEEDEQLKAYISTSQFPDDAVGSLCKRYGVSWKSESVANKNWNEVWESSFTPVKLENFCQVRAEFHQPDADVRYDIVITPKMSFGTGHHATTFLMIEAMSRQAIQDKNVFDFGTGTGVLAILAEKMGAASILAIDNDPWSIENGNENIKKNNCRRTTLKMADHLEAGNKFDLILANITRNIIIEHLQSLAEALFPGGIVLLSGFLKEDLLPVKQALAENKITITTYTERNGWLCVEGKG